MMLWPRYVPRDGLTKLNQKLFSKRGGGSMMRLCVYGACIIIYLRVFLKEHVNLTTLKAAAYELV